MTRDTTEQSVFDRSPAGRHVQAERLDQAGAESISIDAADASSIEDGTRVRTGHFVAEGRKDDPMFHPDRVETPAAYHWNPTPPREGSNAGRCY